MKHSLHTFLICILVLALHLAKAQPGQNDPTFNLNDFNDGDGTGANGAVDCIAMQNNGKIIIGGSFSTYNKKNVNGIVRLNNEGTIEKVNGYQIEPPTLFKGRGKHPKAGCLKPRIQP
jgi:hypothetical protein